MEANRDSGRLYAARCGGAPAVLRNREEAAAEQLVVVVLLAWVALPGSGARWRSAALGYGQRAAALRRGRAVQVRARDAREMAARKAGRPTHGASPFIGPRPWPAVARTPRWRRRRPCRAWTPVVAGLRWAWRALAGARLGWRVGLGRANGLGPVVKDRINIF